MQLSRCSANFCRTACSSRLGQAMVFDLMLVAQDFLDGVVAQLKQPSLHTQML